MASLGTTGGVTRSRGARASGSALFARRSTAVVAPSCLTAPSWSFATQRWAGANRAFCTTPCGSRQGHAEGDDDRKRYSNRYIKSCS